MSLSSIHARIDTQTSIHAHTKTHTVNMIILISLSVRFRGQKYAKADIGKRVTVTGKQEPTRSTRARAEWHENERGQSRAESGGGDIKKENMEQEKEGGRGVGLKKRGR